MTNKFEYYSNEYITKLLPTEMFVFGSNMAGVHGAGAARTALQKFDACFGVGVGVTGQCYAIPTKDQNIETMPLKRIKLFVKAFIDYAKENPKKDFIVTKIGCGLAGYTNKQIAPLFKDSPSNCIFHEDWREYLE